MIKGKDKFTSAEILELRELIAERQNASRNYQKQSMYLQLIIPQYFISNKSGIWSLSLIVHSKG